MVNVKRVINEEYWTNLFKSLTEDDRRLKKILKDLKKYTDRPATQPGHVAVGNQEENLDPFVFFPASVWDIIFDNLMNVTESVKNCCRVFPALNEVLAVKKTRWVFPLIMAPLARYLDTKTVLNLRYVCKHWNRGVELYLEQHPRWQVYNEAKLVSSHPDSLANATIHVDLPILNLVDEFSTQMAAWSSAGGTPSHRKNPFLGRAVRVVCGQNNSDAWQEGLINLAHNFGSQIYFLDLVVDMNPVKLSGFLPKLLHHMPNLRWLTLNGQSKFGKKLKQSDNMVEKFFRNFVRYPLPRLSHLKVMSLNIDTVYPDLNRYLTTIYGKQLTVLTVRTKDMAVERYQHFGDMTKLEQLVLVNFIPRRAKDIFYKFAERAANLERLTLVLPPRKVPCTDVRSRVPSMKKLLGWLQWKSLKTLEIQSKMPLVDFMGSIECQEECQLPSVTTFSVTICPEFDYDILLLMPNLTSLHLTIDLESIPDFFEHPRFLINLNRDLDLGSYVYQEFHKNLDLYQSKVWVKCEHLKILTVNGCHGDDKKSFHWKKTRAGYNTFCQTIEVHAGV